jgi:ACS family hexuronate transporter-like MFS transporter
MGTFPPHLRTAEPAAPRATGTAPPPVTDIGAGSAAAPAAAASSFRWWICALLFLASGINYIDRQVLAILKPDLQVQFGWSDLDYGRITIAFQLAYAAGLLLAGPVIDRIGVRVGFALAIVIWSLAAVAHALASVFGSAAAALLGLAGLTYSGSVAGFVVARFALGIGESGNFPAAIKTVAEWFPKRERALATGIFNAGTNVGAVVAPIVVPLLALAFGWQAAFIGTGVIGFAWLVAWWALYRAPDRHPRVSASELALIRADAESPVARTPWRAIVTRRQAWAFAAGKAMTDPVWWLYLTWIPDYLHRNHGLNLLQLGLPMVIIYLVADVGSVAGGWLSSTLIRRGWSVNSGRKMAMLVCALAVVPVMFAGMTSNLWVAVALISVAAAAHQGWSCNLFTLTSDMFPRQAVGSVVGFGGMIGGVASMIVTYRIATLLDLTGSYVPVFLAAGFAYLAALAVIHVLAPRLEAAR